MNLHTPTHDSPSANTHRHEDPQRRALTFVVGRHLYLSIRVSRPVLLACTFLVGIGGNFWLMKL